jgi:hypothetical protein
MPTMTLMSAAQFQENMHVSKILFALTGVDPMENPVAPNGANWLNARIAD